MAVKKLIEAVEARSAAAQPLLRQYRWCKWGQPVPVELRPALCLVADVLGEPIAPMRQILETLEDSDLLEDIG